MEIGDLVGVMFVSAVILAVFAVFAMLYEAVAGNELPGIEQVFTFYVGVFVVATFLSVVLCCVFCVWCALGGGRGWDFLQ